MCSVPFACSVALAERPGRKVPLGHLIGQALAPYSGMVPAGCRGFKGPVPQPLWMSALSMATEYVG
jgi:hypothetical protein